MLIEEWEKKIAALLRFQDSPDLCARLLIRFAGGWSEVGYFLALRDEMSGNTLKKLWPLVERRMSGEPISYILGKRDFYAHDYLVSPATLIPRPETELLVDLALARLPGSPLEFMDAGCGSGCIGLELMLARSSWHGILIDNSMEALKIAKANGKRLGCDPAFCLADMKNLPVADESLDLLVSNPPYIDPACKKEVMPQVLAYEPHSALFSEKAGLGRIMELAREAARILRRSGCLVFEHGHAQACACREILDEAGFTNIEDYEDFAHLPRCMIGYKA